MLGLLNMNLTVRPLDPPGWVADLLSASPILLFGRLALTLPYWRSGFDKLARPQAALVEIPSLNP